jgi:hypothetical protein
MASNPTKILLYDLDATLGQVMKDLQLVQGDFDTLYDRLTHIGVDLMDDDTKAILQDLIDGQNSSGKLTIERITDNLNSIKVIQDQLKVDLSDDAEGTQTFLYDSYQNVQTETLVGLDGATIFSTTYNYSDAASGKLNTSVKTYTDTDDNTITLTKTYGYDSNDNIHTIETTKTVTAPTTP